MVDKRNKIRREFYSIDFRDFISFISGGRSFSMERGYSLPDIFCTRMKRTIRKLHR